MVAGITTLEVLQEENLIANAAKLGEAILDDLRSLIDRFEFVHDVRGRGMLMGIEFGPPRSLKLKAAWKMLETAASGLFCQMVTVPLLQKHHILSQTAGHDMNVVELAIADGRLHCVGVTSCAPDFDYQSLQDAHFPWVVEKMAELAVEKALAGREA